MITAKKKLVEFHLGNQNVADTRLKWRDQKSALDSAKKGLEESFLGIENAAHESNAR